MVKFLAEILAESSVTNFTAHEVAEPAKWLLKAEIPLGFLIFRQRGLKSRAPKAGRITRQYNFYYNWKIK